MNPDGNEEDGDEAEEDDGVDQYWDATRLHVPEVDYPVVPGQLEQQPRAQQHEQHHRDHHRPPIRHFFWYLSSIASRLSMPSAFMWEGERMKEQIWRR